MSTSLTLMGAGGKMGSRITDQIADDPAYDVSYVEPDAAARENLHERGLEATPQDEALAGADVVVMAVPDELMGPICEEIVDEVDAGAMIVLLDPAAAYGGVLPDADVSYFLTHPCHPSFFNAETSIAAENPDWFGGQGRDVQHVVCALHQGPEEDYARGEAIARDIYAPVDRASRVTTEQMALLEPALSETLTATCLSVIHEGLEEVVEMGVPEQAARDFLFGHIRIELGIIFGFTDFPLSDGAQEAVAEAKRELFREDWKERVFDLENVRASAREIATADD
jgi:hypothetical protein